MTVRKQKNGRVPRSAEPLRVANPHAAGIDVHAAVHWVAVPPDHLPSPKSVDADAGDTANVPPHVRKFGTCTADLELLADWLRQCGVTSVAMESTGVYWIPLFELLERRGFQVNLVNPRQRSTLRAGPRPTCSIASGFSGCIATVC
jgi:transposase